MPKFMIAYHGGNRPSSPEEGKTHMENWKKWIADLGDTVINPGTPLPTSKIVTNNGVEDDSNANAMNGFAVISVETFEQAIEIAKSDPFLKMEGTIRVSQMMEMN